MLLKIVQKNFVYIDSDLNLEEFPCTNFISRKSFVKFSEIFKLEVDFVPIFPTKTSNVLKLKVITLGVLQVYKVSAKLKNLFWLGGKEGGKELTHSLTHQHGGRRSVAGMAQHSIPISTKESPFYKEIPFNFIYLHFHRKWTRPQFYIGNPFEFFSEKKKSTLKFCFKNTL